MRKTKKEVDMDRVRNLDLAPTNEHEVKLLKREPFIVGISFSKKVNLNLKYRVGVDFAGEKFREGFLPFVPGKVTARKLHAYTLNRPTKDQVIIGEGKNNLGAAILLENFLQLIGAQKGGREGPLLVKDGAPNIFYLHSVNAELLSVSARWMNSEWVLGAYPVSYFGSLVRGARVFLPAHFKVPHNLVE